MKYLIPIFLSVCMLTAGIVFSPKSEALSDNSRVPILLYHPRHVSGDCSYGNSDLTALEQDLETLHEEGYTVLPLYWLVEWSLGWRRGDTLPDNVVAITLDDGYDSDFLIGAPGAPEECGQQKSAHSILEAFHEKYKDELPDLSPHISTFVIASKEVRKLLEENSFQDNWWATAHASKFMEVYNHGTSHDHPVIQEKLWDDEMEVWLPESGHDDGIWEGKLMPERIVSLDSNRIYIRDSAQYIADKIGAWPDLFAYPMGKVSHYTKNVYLPYYFHEHGTVAAFCTERAGRGPHPLNYMTRSSDRWCLPRLTHGYSWRTPEEFLGILRGSGQ